jgi:hypothetical protein
MCHRFTEQTLKTVFRPSQSWLDRCAYWLINRRGIAEFLGVRPPDTWSPSIATGYGWAVPISMSESNCGMSAGVCPFSGGECGFGNSSTFGSRVPGHLFCVAPERS